MTITAEHTFPQVSAISGCVEPVTIGSVTYTSRLRSDLRKRAFEVQVKPTISRSRRHRLETELDRALKLSAETGFDLDGAQCAVPQEGWSRPQAMVLYHKLMQQAPGQSVVDDYTGDDIRHLAWMLEEELLDIAEDGSIWPLSDVEPSSRKYPGAPVSDERAGVGGTRRREETRKLVLEVWNMIVDGHPVMEIPAEYRREMRNGKNVRISTWLIAAHMNRLRAARLDQECSCLGRDLVKHAWDLRDHGDKCIGRKRWHHAETVREAICEMVKDLTLTRVSGAIITRKGHTEHRIPSAYAIPADAGWHAYAAAEPRPRRRRYSRLRNRLLGDAPCGAEPPVDKLTVTEWSA